VSALAQQQPQAVSEAGAKAGSPASDGRHAGESNFQRWLCSGGATRVTALVILLALISSLGRWLLRAQLGFSLDDIAEATVAHQAQGGESPSGLVLQIVRWSLAQSFWIDGLNAVIGVVVVATLLYMAFGAVGWRAKWRDALSLTALAGIGQGLLSTGLSSLVIFLKPISIDEFVAGPILTTSMASFVSQDAPAFVIGVARALDLQTFAWFAFIGWGWRIIARSGTERTRPFVRWMILLLAGTVLIRALGGAVLGM